MAESDTPQQIVVCCDGTNNNLTGRTCDTNVVKLCELLARDPDPERLLFYDPGVGNPGHLPGATSWDKLQRIAERVAGLAFGRGVYENIADAYLFLMRNHRPGSRIFIFGFSRGAFTARSLAGLVNQFGLLQPQMESMLPTLLHTYFADREDERSHDAIARITRQTTELFAGPATRRVEIQFVGVWDTVASVGMPPFAARFTALPTAGGKRFVHVRQALALDEHRAQFQPRPYIDANGPIHTDIGTPGSIEQLWFRGDHCDIGGGHVQDEAGLADHALCWLVSESVRAGLRLAPRGAPLDSEPAVAQALVDVNTPPAAGTLHSQLWHTSTWALTGLAVRDNKLVRLDDGQTIPLLPHEHPSVAEQAPLFPAGTEWARARGKAAMLACLVLIPLLVLFLGHQLAGEWAGGSLAGLLRANADFAWWQLSAWWPGTLGQTVQAFHAPRWAVVWDLALVAAYAYALSWWAVRAFARRAGCRRAGQPVSSALNRLGWALPLAVFADLAEDAATWFVVTLAVNDFEVLARLASLPMAVFAAAKFVGLAGTAVLIVWGLASRGLQGKPGTAQGQPA